MRGRVFKRIVIGFLVLLALLLGGSLWLYQDVLGPGQSPEDWVQAESATPEPAADALPAPPPAPPEYAPAPSAETPPASDANEFVVKVTEKEANELVRTKPEIRQALEQAKVSDLRLRFEPDQLVAEARVPVWGKLKARVSAAGRVWSEDGKLAFETRTVRAGSIPAPNAFREELDEQIGAPLTRLNREHRGRFEDVQIRDGELEIRGTKQPVGEEARRGG
ncbi:MAG: hypothetical protein ACO1SX_04795, partial [Actinomycetota bacterium]